MSEILFKMEIMIEKKKTNFLDKIRIMSNENFDDLKFNFLKMRNETHCLFEKTLFEIKENLDLLKKNLEKTKTNKEITKGNTINSLMNIGYSLIPNLVPFLGNYLIFTNSYFIYESILVFTNLVTLVQYDLIQQKNEFDLVKLNEFNIDFNDTFNTYLNLEHEYYTLLKDYDIFFKNKKYILFLKLMIFGYKISLVFFNYIEYLQYQYETIIFWIILIISVFVFYRKFFYLKKFRFLNLIKFFSIIIVIIFFIFLIYDILKSRKNFQKFNINRTRIKFNNIKNNINSLCKWKNLSQSRKYTLRLSSLFDGFKSITLDKDGFLVNDKFCNTLKEELSFNYGNYSLEFYNPSELPGLNLNIFFFCCIVLFLLL